MSYPLLRLSDDRAWVEIRKGRGAVTWNDMERVFEGAARAGQEWRGDEGGKLPGRCCISSSHVDSTLSLPYAVHGQDGVNVGQAVELAFPDDMIWKASLHGQAFVLHEDPISANCYKIRLTAALLGLPLSRRAYDIRKSETRTPEFLARVNANGRIPVLEIAGASGIRFLPESNAACWYLASGSRLIPTDRFAQADMLRWMFFEQYNHEPNVATLRFWLAYLGEENLSDAQKGQLDAKRSAGEAALRLMDEHLAMHDWFVGHGITLADIALFAYTHVAGEGGFVLDDFPAIQRWIGRIEALPGFVPLN